MHEYNKSHSCDSENHNDNITASHAYTYIGTIHIGYDYNNYFVEWGSREMRRDDRDKRVRLCNV